MSRHGNNSSLLAFYKAPIIHSSFDVFFDLNKLSKLNISHVLMLIWRHRNVEYDIVQLG